MSRSKRADDAAAAELERARQPRSFDDAFAHHNLTRDERVTMVWHLAMFRARKTVEALLPQTDQKLIIGFNPKDILRASHAKEEGKS